MGFRVAVVLGFALLLFGGNFSSATQNRSIFSTNETLHQIPRAQVTTSLEQNRTEQKHPVRPPTTYRLRTFQLRAPAVPAVDEKPAQSVEEQVGTSEKAQRAQPRMLTSEPQEPGQTAQEMLKLVDQGSDLSLPLKKESKVV